MREDDREPAGEPSPAAGPAGAQTLLRGLAVLEAVGEGRSGLAAIAAFLGLSRSTTHRLASALVEARYLVFDPAHGYRLGPKLLSLGDRAKAQRPLVQVARPILERLAEETEDTVHLGEREGLFAVYLDKVPGRRRVEIRSKIGERQPLASTGLGKALIFDASPDVWARACAAAPPADGAGAWGERMRAYAENGVAFDLEENEDRIRCVAAPVRDASGAIVAAISLTGAAHYMDDAHLRALAARVASAAAEIGAALGWRGDAAPR